MLHWIGVFLAILLIFFVGYLTDWWVMQSLLLAHWKILIPIAMLHFLPVAAAAESTRALVLGKLRRSYFLFLFDLVASGATGFSTINRKCFRRNCRRIFIAFLGNKYGLGYCCNGNVIIDNNFLNSTALSW